MPETLFDSVFDLATLTITDENLTLLRENQEFISYLRHVSAPPKCPYVDIFPSENKLIEAPESGIRFLLSAEGEITGSKLKAGIDERYYIKSFVPPVDPNDERDIKFFSLFEYRGYLLLVTRYTPSVYEFRTSGNTTRIWALTYDDKVESFERKIEGRELFVPKQLAEKHLSYYNPYFSCLLEDSTSPPSLVLWRREGEKSQLLRLGDVEGNSFVITACKSLDVKHSISIMKESMWKNSFARQQNIALDKKGNVWISSGRSLYVFSPRFELIAQQEPEEFVSIFSSPDGNVLCKNKWSPKIYSLNLLHLPKDCKQEVTRKDKYIFTGDSDGTIKIWDLNKIREETQEDLSSKANIKTLTGHTDWVRSIIITKDQQQIVSASDDKTIKIWSIASGECIKTFSGHTDHVRSIVLTKDQQHIISASEDRTIKIWNVATGECVKTLIGHTNYITSIVMTEDQQQIISASNDDTIKIWNVATGECVKIFFGHTNCVRSVIMTEDQQQIISASNDRSIKIWKKASGECVKTLIGHKSYVSFILITKDQKRIISASYDRTIKIWNIASGECINTLTGHKYGLVSIAITEDQQQVISVGYDRMIKIWNIATGECVKTLTGSVDGIQSLALLE